MAEVLGRMEAGVGCKGFSKVASNFKNVWERCTETNLGCSGFDAQVRAPDSSGVQGGMCGALRRVCKPI